MLGRTHMLLGAVANIMVMPVLGYEIGILTTCAAAIGALIPDMDHPRALINQKLLPIQNKITKMMIYCSIGVFLLSQNKSYADTWLTQLGFVFILFGMSSHRGFSHSILGTLLISTAIFGAFADVGGKPLSVAIVIGIISHLIGDMLTREGVKLFYPFSKRNIYFPMTISTGGVVENIINIVMVIVILQRWV